MNIKITGLDKLQRELKDAQRAFQSLDGVITTLKCNSADPESVRSAIRQMETAIDSKAAPYRNNQLVSQVVQEMKDRYRKEILKRVNRNNE